MYSDSDLRLPVSPRFRDDYDAIAILRRSQVSILHLLKKKEMDSGSTDRKHSRASPTRIDTVVEFVTSDSDEFDAEDSSRNTPIPSTIGVGCATISEQPTSPARSTSQNRRAIAIQLKVSTNEDGNRGVIEARSTEPHETFLKGPVSLLTKSDLMSMIQEGIRMGISDIAKDNRIKVMARTHTQLRNPSSIGSSSAAVTSNSPEKTMKYILHQYKPKNFQILRRLNGIKTDDFLHSICDEELLGGFTEASGKSGSIFWYSKDKKYIMKSISSQESSLLQKISSSYTRYMGSHPHSLLCRFVGMYKIVTTVATPSYISGNKRPSRVRPNTVLTTRFVIMKNIFCETASTGVDKFDLKGTTEDRFVRKVSGNEVLKDINFQNRWISLPDSLADCLTRVIEEDSEFLLRHGIMDYSMIVGVSPATDKPAADRLITEAEGEAVETCVTSLKRKNMKEKINAHIAKAAESMQKFFAPRSSASIRVSEPGDASSSDHDNDPEDEPPTAFGLERVVSPRQAIPSVFTTFREGVVGVDENVRVPVIYYLGIIDILQQYTVKKKAANLIKRCTIGCCHEIDTVAPSYYRSRFVRYLSGKIQSIDADRLETVAKTFEQSPAIPQTISK